MLAVLMAGFVVVPDIVGVTALVVVIVVVDVVATVTDCCGWLPLLVTVLVNGLRVWS